MGSAATKAMHASLSLAGVSPRWLDNRNSNGEAIAETRFEKEDLIIEGAGLLMRHWPDGPLMRYTK